MSSVRIHSPAKINLGLRIVGKNNGYHLLESLFWPITLVDDIELRPGNTNRVEMTWEGDSPCPALPSEKENIVSRMLKKIGSHWCIRIRKRIPLGAGLGGGSSNAGTILRMVSQNKVFDLARNLGADVPFFLNPRPSWITGIGDRIRPLNFDKTAGNLFFLVIVLPQPLSTKEVFSLFDKTGQGDSNPETFQWPETPSKEDLKKYLKWTRNDLETPATNLLPLIGTLLEKLRRFPVCYAGMTGSGSSCIAVFDTDQMRHSCIKEMTRFFRENSCTSIKAETFYLKN